MTEILISDEEREQYFMGDIALDKAAYERQIQELERRLGELTRHNNAAFEELKITHEYDLEKTKRGYQGSSNKIDQLERENDRLRDINKRNKKMEAIHEKFDRLEDGLKKAKKKGYRRVGVELENAKMMILALHSLHTGSSSTELNNLVCAIREYAKEGLGFDVDDYNQGPMLKEMMLGHLLALWQPHKTVVGAWTKDADPSVQPFKGIIEVKDGK